MADLDLDLDELSSLAARVRSIANEFERAERISDDTAGYTGHDRLAAKVHEFGEKWDIAREKLRSNLEFLAASMTAIVDTFTDLDNAHADAVSSVSEAAAPPAGAPSPGAPAPEQTFPSTQPNAPGSASGAGSVPQPVPPVGPSVPSPPPSGPPPAATPQPEPLPDLQPEPLPVDLAPFPDPATTFPEDSFPDSDPMPIFHPIVDPEPGAGGPELPPEQVGSIDDPTPPIDDAITGPRGGSGPAPDGDVVTDPQNPATGSTHGTGSTPIETRDPIATDIPIDAGTPIEVSDTAPEADEATSVPAAPETGEGTDSPDTAREPSASSSGTDAPETGESDEGVPLWAAGVPLAAGVGLLGAGTASFLRPPHDEAEPAPFWVDDTSAQETR